jgi:hypothetical protein
MKRASKWAVAFALLIRWASCSAQGTPASPEALPVVDNTSSPAAAIPIPQEGDPFYAPVATPGAPQTLHERFMDYAVITYGPRSLLTPMIGAGFTMLRPPSAYPREWRQGMEAFGRIYGSSIATRASEQTARFLTAAVLHEDFRYRPSTSKNPWARSFHALAFTFIDKSDSGHNRIALANYLGAAAGGFTPNLYLPDGYNTLSHGETRMAIAFGGFAVRNLTREFAPELFRLTHRHHIPFPRIPVPEWWTPRD